MIQKKGNMPKHIAVIMDGNGRWAQKRGLPRSQGHAQGVETLREVLSLCKEFGVDHLTAYAFSTENWKRSQQEVNALMHLLVEYLKVEIVKLKEEKIKLRVIGNLETLPEAVREGLEVAISELDKYDFTRTLTLALSYGGRDEIVRAAREIAANVAEHKIKIADIDEALFSSCLDTAGIPDPDLLIRTAGELRLSNFMLWQLSYTELYATKVFWPDFSRTEFIEAIDNFQERTRKFGEIEKNDNT